jgi:hypothetical protein
MLWATTQPERNRSIVSDYKSLQEALLQALETGRQSAAGELTADDPGAEFARFIAQQQQLGTSQEN